MPEYLAGAEPFYFEGSPIGCLLIHGFGGTPYEMRGLGTFLFDRYHCTVAGPALAGHATDVRELLLTDWRHWYDSVDASYRQLRENCEQVFAVGLSMGGILGLHLAAHRSLDGVVAVSAPAYISHPWIPFFQRFSFLHRLFPIVSDNGMDDDTQDPTVAAEHPSYKETVTLAARSLVLDLIPHVRHHLPGITTPALLLQGRQDRTIPSDSMSLIYSELGSRDKQMAWLEPSGHLALEDYAKADAFRLIAGFVESHERAPAKETVRNGSAQ